ncbi:MAG: type II toxin-antitoxin system YafQ family toxin [Chlorobiaceae bacterium]
MSCLSGDRVYVDHPLKGQYHRKRDCHLEPDWILIYALEDQELVLYPTGSHADLFR